MEMRMTTGFDIIGSNKALQDHWLRRIVALVIDGIIIGIITGIIGLFVWILAPWSFFGWFFWGALVFLYFVIFEIAFKGTLGKKLMSLDVVSVEGELEFVASLIRNASKIIPFFLIVDWLVGMFTDGDPRQKWTDRIASTTVQRNDDRAYVEQQFRQMAYVPPQPTYQPPPAQPYQQPYQGPQQPEQQPAQAPGAAWPHQEEKPKSDWPQHTPGQPPAEQPPPQQQPYQPPSGEEVPRFCQSCGNTLTPGADGRPTCAKCGSVY